MNDGKQHELLAQGYHRTAQSSPAHDETAWRLGRLNGLLGEIHIAHLTRTSAAVCLAVGSLLVLSGCRA